MGEDQGWLLTSEHHLRSTYISARYVQGNAASSGREEKRGSKTYKCLPPSSAHFLLPTFSPSTCSPSSEVSNELCPTSIRAQIASCSKCHNFPSLSRPLLLLFCLSLSAR